MSSAASAETAAVEKDSAAVVECPVGARRARAGRGASTFSLRQRVVPFCRVARAARDRRSVGLPAPERVERLVIYLRHEPATHKTTAEDGAPTGAHLKLKASVLQASFQVSQLVEVPLYWQ